MRTTPQIIVSKANRAIQKYYTVKDVGKALQDAPDNSIVILQPGDFRLQGMNVPENVRVLAKPGALLPWDRGYVVGATENVVDLNVFGGIKEIKDIFSRLFYLQTPSGTTLRGNQDSELIVRVASLQFGSEETDNESAAVDSGNVKLFYSEPDDPNNNLLPIQSLDNTSDGYSATLSKAEIGQSKNIFVAYENNLDNPLDSATLTVFLNPETVDLSVTQQAFIIKKDGTVIPESITLSSTSENVEDDPEWAVIDTDPNGFDIELIDDETGLPLTFSSSISLPYSNERTANVRIENTTIENNFGVKNFTVRAQDDVDTFDEFTIVVLEEGDDGFTVALTNENHTFPAEDVNGNVKDSELAFGKTSAIVYQGAEKFTYDDNLTTKKTWRFDDFTIDAGGDIEEVEPEGAMVVSKSGNEIVVDSFSGGNVASVKANITVRNRKGNLETFTKQITYTKAIPGNDSREIVLTSDALVFKVLKSGEPEPEIINFEVLQQNILKNLNWSTNDATPLQSISNSGAELRFVDMVDSAVSVTVESDDGEFSDTITIPKLREGSDAFSIIMSNENHTVTADENANPVNLTGAQTDLLLFKGIDEITTDSDTEFTADAIDGVSIVDGSGSAIAENGVIPSISGNRPEFNINSIDAGELTATVRVAATYKGTFVGSKVFTLSIARRGFPGDDAELLKLDAEGQTFKILKDGSIDPTTISLVASAENADESMINWSSPDSSVDSVLNNQSGVQRDVDVGDLTNESALVEVTLGSLSDRIRLYKLREGSDAINVILSNSNHTFPAGPTGVVPDFQPGGNCEIRVFQGINEIPFENTGNNGTIHYRITNKDHENSQGSDYGTFEKQIGDYIVYKVGDGDGVVPTSELSFTVNFKVQAFVSDGNTKIPQQITYSKSVEGEKGDKGELGDPGPGVVYRGEFDSTKTYFYTVNSDGRNIRRDVVLGSDDEYYLTTASGPNATNNWDDPTTSTSHWEPYGSTFESIATGLLLTQDATITRTLTMGNTSTKNIGLIRAAVEPTPGEPLYEIGSTTTGDEGIIFRDKDGKTVFSVFSNSGATIKDLNVEGLLVTGDLEMTTGSITNSGNDFKTSSEGYSIRQDVVTGFPLGLEPPTASRSISFVSGFGNNSTTGGYISSIKNTSALSNRVNILATNEGGSNYNGSIKMGAKGTQSSIRLETFYYKNNGGLNTNSFISLNNDTINISNSDVGKLQIDGSNGTLLSNMNSDPDSTLLMKNGRIKMRTRDQINIRCGQPSTLSPISDFVQGKIFIQAQRRIEIISENTGIIFKADKGSVLNFDSGIVGDLTPEIRMRNGFIIFKTPLKDSGANTWAVNANLSSGEAAIGAYRPGGGNNINLLWIEQKYDGNLAVDSAF